jgi:replicative DNA helicase
MKRLLKQTTARIDYLFQNKGEITGLATGISDLDKKTSGLQGGELIILAARPSMGKTALALNFVQNALFTQDSPVIVFSLEMPATQLMMRLYSSVGSICQGKLRNGKLDESDWPKLELAARRLKDRPLFIDETGNLTCADVRSKVKQVASTNGSPALVMIDYLQLMRGNNQSSREQQVSEISRTLKAIAKDFNCPVVALSQLNRGVESRPNKRPMNSDLRESGAIEQDADLILFIYRDEYYNPETKDKGIAELIIGKQRNGELGVCLAAYEGRYTRFQNPPVMQGRDVGDGYF